VDLRLNGDGRLYIVVNAQNPQTLPSAPLIVKFHRCPAGNAIIDEGVAELTDPLTWVLLWQNAVVRYRAMAWCLRPGPWPALDRTVAVPRTARARANAEDFVGDHRQTTDKDGNRLSNDSSALIRSEVDAVLLQTFPEPREGRNFSVVSRGGEDVELLGQ
jgi:hypothetical protein